MVWVPPLFGAFLTLAREAPHPLDILAPYAQRKPKKATIVAYADLATSHTNKNDSNAEVDEAGVL